MARKYAIDHLNEIINSVEIGKIDWVDAELASQHARDEFVSYRGGRIGEIVIRFLEYLVFNI
jgi:hypothetical protein